MSERINVIGPDGRVGSVPSDKIDDAIRMGYKVESPEQKEINDFVDENKGVKGFAKVAGGQFLDEAVFGIPEVIAQKKADPLEVAKWEALKKEQSVANALGGTAGFISNFFVGGPVFKAAAKAGVVAEKAATSALAKAGIKSAEVVADQGAKQAIKQTAKNIVAKSIEKGAQLGTEGAIIGVPMAITEAALGDPDLAAETLMWSAGLGGGLGVVFGGGSNAIKEIYNSQKVIRGGRAAAERVAATKEEIAKLYETLPREQADEAVAKIVEDNADNPSIIEFLTGESQKEIKNAQEIRGIMGKYGIEEVPGALSASPASRGSITALEASPTYYGSKAYEKLESGRNKVQDVVSKEILSVDPTDIGSLSVSKSATGKTISERISQKIGDMAESFNKRYAPIEEQAKKVAADEDSLLRIYEEAQNLKNQAPSLLKNVSAKTKAAIDDALSAKTADDISKVRTAVGNEIKAAERAADYNTVSALTPIYQGLTSAREASLAKAGLSDVIRPIDVDYKAFKEFLKELSGEAKLGRVDSRAKVVDKLANITGEQMVQKMLNPKNARATQFFAKNFPEEFKLATDFLKKDLAATYNTNGKLQVGNVLKKLEDFDDSVKELILGKGGKEALDDLRKVYDVMPKFMEHNPSGTSRGFQLTDILNMKQNINDAVVYHVAFSKDRTKAILAAEKAMKQTAEKLDEIPTIVSTLSTRSEKVRDPKTKARPIGKPAFPAVSEKTLRSKDMTSDDMRQALLMSAISRISGEKIRSKEEKEQLENLLMEAIARPESFQEKLDPLIEAISDTGAPNVSAAMRQKASTAINFLFTSLPRAPKPRDIMGNTKHRPSDFELSQFNRRLEAVIDPMVVLDRVKKGNLTSDHVLAIKTVYPSLYQEMTKKMLSYLAVDKPKLSYQAKSQLTMLLGIPVDSTMSPEDILKLQKTFEQDLQKPENSGVQIKTNAAERESLRP